MCLPLNIRSIYILCYREGKRRKRGGKRVGKGEGKDNGRGKEGQRKGR